MKKTDYAEKNFETFQKIIDEKKVKIETLFKDLQDTKLKLMESKTEAETLMYENKINYSHDEIASAKFHLVEASIIMQNAIKDGKAEE